MPAPGLAADRRHQGERGRRRHGQSWSWLSRFCRFRAPHGLAETRAGHSGGGRCLSRFWARPPRGPVGSAPSARRQTAAFVRAAFGARSRHRSDCAAAPDADVGTCPDRLSDHPAVTQRLSHPVPARRVRRGRHYLLQRRGRFARRRHGPLRRNRAGAPAPWRRDRDLHHPVRRNRCLQCGDVGAHV